VALEFLRANVARPITADELQDAVGTSLRTIQIKFQRVLGRSPWDELRRLRLDHAAELLRTTNMKVEAVALRCGFDYLSHFSRAFAQWQGVAPSQYRLRHRTAG
jgi:LacI family transcriptional regulator, galactose operon repressor